MNPENEETYQRSDATLIILSLAICLGVGACLGWTARTLSTRDELLVATIAKENTKTEYYNAQLQKVLGDERAIKEKKVPNGGTHEP